MRLQGNFDIDHSGVKGLKFHLRPISYEICLCDTCTPVLWSESPRFWKQFRPTFALCELGELYCSFAVQRSHYSQLCVLSEALGLLLEAPRVGASSSMLTRECFVGRNPPIQKIPVRAPIPPRTCRRNNQTPSWYSCEAFRPYLYHAYSFTCHMFRNYESLILARSLFFRKKRSPFVHWSISLVLFRAGQLVTSFWSKNTREWAKEMSAAQEKCETRKFQGRKHKEMSNWQEF